MKEGVQINLDEKGRQEDHEAAKVLFPALAHDDSIDPSALVSDHLKFA